MIVLFDTLETLFSFKNIRKKFMANGLSPDLLELWHARVFESALAFTLSGKKIKYGDLEQSILRQIFRERNIPERHADDLIQAVHDRAPREDAADCLRSLRADGHRLVAVTNSSGDDEIRLLQRSELWKWFERMYSAETVNACKHFHGLYELLCATMLAAPYECCMVSAYPSDILSAGSLGMNTLFIVRDERQWPFSGINPDFTVTSLKEIPGILIKAFGKPKPAMGPGMSAEGKRYGQA